MSRSGAEIRRSANQQKVIQDRITAIEEHLGQLCDLSSSYTRKTAKLRDKGDLMAKQLMEYSEYEKWNPSLRHGMARFAEILSAVQDYREAEVKRLEGKIITPLMNYGLLCKQTKNDLKSAFATRDREQNLKKKLETIKAKSPQDRQKISQLENELQRASIDASRSGKALEQQTDSFEAKKLKDMKKVMQDFVTIEMHFHAKALELYTQCFQTIENIDTEADLEEFRHQLRPDGSIRSDIARSASQASLESRQNSSGNTTPRKLPSVTNNSTPPKPTVSKQSTPAKQSVTTPAKQNVTPVKPSNPAKPPTPTDGRKKIPAPTQLDLPTDSDEDDDDDDDYDTEDDSEDETTTAPPLPKRR